MTAKKTSATRAYADPTRKKILCAARKCFVKQGFAGTSISTIAKTAGINQSLIYHHFENKSDLWKQVKSDTFQRYADTTGHGLDEVITAKTFLEFIDAFVRLRFDFYEKNPAIRRMFDWQRMESDDTLRAVHSSNIDKILKCLEAFQATGEIRQDIEPRLMLVFILHSSISYFSTLHNYYIKELPHASDELKQQYLTLTIESIARGLTPAV